MTVTRWFGPLSGNRSAERTIGVRDARPNEPPPSKPLAEGLVALSGSGTTKVTLEAPHASGTTITPATVRASDAAGTGEATDDLQLADGAAAPHLKVTVRMQDFILWPLAAILLGALVGQVLPQRWAIRRRGGLLRDSLVSGVNDYDRSRASGVRSGAPGLEDISGDVGASRDFRRGLRNRPKPRWWLQKLWFSPSPTDGAAGLYSRLGRIETNEDLAERAQETEALLTRISNWRSADAALAQLSGAITEATVVRSLNVEQRVPLTDADKLFLSDIKVAHDSATGATENSRISGQTVVLRLYASAMPTYLEIRERDRELDEDARRRLSRSDPLEIYIRYSGARQRSANATARLTSELADALNELRFLRAGLPAVHDFALPEGAEAVLTVAFASIGERFDQLIGHLVDTVAPTSVPSTARVLAGIRRGDWLLFWTAVLAAALAYLLPLYAGKAWGSASDYASAFAAGFVGTVAINAARLPLTRSYRAFPDPSADGSAPRQTTTETS